MDMRKPFPFAGKHREILLLTENMISIRQHTDLRQIQAARKPSRFLHGVQDIAFCFVERFNNQCDTRLRTEAAAQGQKVRDHILAHLTRGIFRNPSRSSASKNNRINAQIRRTVEHIEEKYGENGYLRLWLPCSKNQAGLDTLREWLGTGELWEVCKRFG